MWRRCARCWEKTSDAQFAEEGREPGRSRRRATRSGARADWSALQPKTYRYASRRADDAASAAALRELAQQRRRFGYRRLHILLRREGVRMNHKKLYRLYREERLTVRRRGGRKRALGHAGADDHSAGAEPALEPRLRLRRPGRRRRFRMLACRR